MKAKSTELVYGIGAKILPIGLTSLLTILSVVPLDIPGYAAVTPNFMLMSVYHWSLYLPEYLPNSAVFILGLLFDLLTTAPVGLSPLILLIARGTMLTQRRYFVGRSFPFVWAGFAVTAGLSSLAMWGVGSILAGVFLEPRSFAFQAVLTVAGFPVLSLLFARLHRLAVAAA